ncbi:MAG TPA: hypothetical protein VIK37_03520 [Candidatus Saccharimonadales bacterium]
MFGSNDKDQPDNIQPTNYPGAPPVPMATPPGEPLVMPPPDPVIAPTAPPLNDSMTPLSAEPPLPPVPETPTIISNSPKKKDADVPATAPAPTVPVNADEDELIDIKQQALHSLAPLVNQLEQTPEEKFKTTMMLIQASDNAALIKDAHDAANAITDEKNRAQALLDVVNEINYFTQHHNSEQN